MTFLGKWAIPAFHCIQRFPLLLLSLSVIHRYSDTPEISLLYLIHRATVSASTLVPVVKCPLCYAVFLYAFMSTSDNKRGLATVIVNSGQTIKRLGKVLGHFLTYQGAVLILITVLRNRNYDENRR